MLLSFARAMLVSAMILLVAAWVVDGSSSFKHCVQEKQQETSTNYPNKNLTAFRFELGIQRDCFVAFVKNHKDEVLAAFTILLTFATIFLWFATGDLVRGAERTAQRQLRAYVFPGEATLILDPIKGPLANVMIKNAGQTPAYETMVLRSAKTILGMEVKIFPDPKKTGRTSKFDLGQGGVAQTEIQLADILKPAGQDALRRGELELYLWGLITYKDIFGKKQTNRFRFVIGGQHKWPSDNRFLVCEEGNKAT